MRFTADERKHTCSPCFRGHHGNCTLPGRCMHASAGCVEAINAAVAAALEPPSPAAATSGPRRRHAVLVGELPPAPPPSPDVEPGSWRRATDRPGMVRLYLAEHGGFDGTAAAFGRALGEDNKAFSIMVSQLITKGVLRRYPAGKGPIARLTLNTGSRPEVQC